MAKLSLVNWFLLPTSLRGIQILNVNWLIPHVLMANHDKTNQGIADHVQNSEDRVGCGYANLSWNRLSILWHRLTELLAAA